MNIKPNAPFLRKPVEGVNEFSVALIQDIEACIARTVSSGRPRIAVFDADGTLWDDDAGEAFFRWQIENCAFEGRERDPWNHYHEWKKRDPHGAYGWLAQISAGTRLDEVHAWAEMCFRSEANQPWPLFQSMHQFIARLQQAGFEIYIVTASVKWAVEPLAMHLLGIARDHVLGVETEVVNGVVTSTVRQPVTYRQGKADALLRATQGLKPVIAAGNTLGDVAILEASIDFKLMIQSQSALVPKLPELLTAEKKLRDYGRPLGWRLHAFRS